LYQQIKKNIHFAIYKNIVWPKQMRLVQPLPRIKITKGINNYYLNLNLKKMKKTILSLFLVTLSCMAFAKTEVRPILEKTIILKNACTFSKQLASKPTKSNKKNKHIKALVNKLALNCSISGIAWADTFELECENGGTSTYVVSGIAWQVICIGSPIGYFSAAFCTDVQSELSTGC
jgi:hypothetical protein